MFSWKILKTIFIYRNVLHRHWTLYYATAVSTRNSLAVPYQWCLPQCCLFVGVRFLNNTTRPMLYNVWHRIVSCLVSNVWLSTKIWIWTSWYLRDIIGQLLKIILNSNYYLLLSTKNAGWSVYYMILWHSKIFFFLYFKKSCVETAYDDCCCVWLVFYVVFNNVSVISRPWLCIAWAAIALEF